MSTHKVIAKIYAKRTGKPYFVGEDDLERDVFVVANRVDHYMPPYYTTQCRHTILHNATPQWVVCILNYRDIVLVTASILLQYFQIAYSKCSDTIFFCNFLHSAHILYHN